MRRSRVIRTDSGQVHLDSGRTVQVFAALPQGDGTYVRVVADLPEAAVLEAARSVSAPDLPLLATADAGEYVRRVVHGEYRDRR